MNDKTLIITSIIGLVGTLGSALITTWVVLNKESSTAKTNITIVQQQKYNLRAEINDPDGYTNVRILPSTKGQILDKIRSGEIFYTHYQTTNWWYVKTPRNRIGYMHRSRIKLIL